MEETIARLRIASRAAVPWLMPRPYTSKMVADVLYLLLIGALHHTILPSLFGQFILVDMMTPWLVTTFVVAPLPRAAVLGLVGALVLETHSAAPAGLYICAYWVLCVAIRLARTTLSWRHAFPWLVTFLLSGAWVVVFEVFVFSVNEGGFRPDLRNAGVQAVRIIFASLIGMLLCRRFMAEGVGEDVP